MNNSRHLFLSLLVVGIGMSACTGKKSGESSAVGSTKSQATPAVTQFAAVVCKQGSVAQVVDAYPQSKMSTDELRKQTMREGMARLQQMQDALPAIVASVLPALKAGSAWNEISDIAGKAASLAKPGRRDSEVVRAIEQFTKDVKAELKSTCADSLKNPVHEQHAEFAVGAIVGYVGKVSVQ